MAGRYFALCAVCGTADVCLDPTVQEPVPSFRDAAHSGDGEFSGDGGTIFLLWAPDAVLHLSVGAFGLLP